LVSRQPAPAVYQSSFSCPSSSICCEQFGYDNLGNSWLANATGIGPPASIPTFSNNQSSANDSYDNAGNATSSGSFDAAGRMTSAAAGGTYVYDGDG
jgi:hypothetical protein